MISAVEALQRLRKGNGRFVEGKNDLARSIGEARRAELTEAQTPFAVILACSDSRVPVELIFDQGFGELFVIRVAGNVATPSQIGSIEYGITALGARLVVVLGHSNCGAVDATLKELGQQQKHGSPNLRAIVDCIRPALEPLMGSDISLYDAVVANVRHSVAQLRHGSEILEKLTDNREIAIVGAEYSIESGKVEFLD